MNNANDNIIKIKSADLKKLIKIERNELNSIGFFLKFALVNPDLIASNKTEQDKFKRKLREFLLDIKDTLYAIELELPVIAVFDNIQKDKNVFPFIHQLAGDQDWHRGDFSIIVSSQTVFDDVIKEAIPFNEKMTFKELSFEDIANHILKQTEKINEQDKDLENLYKQFLKTIAESVKEGDIENGFNQWKEKIENELKALENTNE